MYYAPDTKASPTDSVCCSAADGNPSETIFHINIKLIRPKKHSNVLKPPVYVH